ncbi:phosphatidate cytidylyltransferase [Kingella negevensis]|uniref:phosphatidate cytidylyltransferase n=1 Tax=Kingella negevensis TaxID=1522312 RepID=UPI00050A332C|nr:phosphatidate cytidylyltransferase [Kingella negevensis]MDK4689158.1 phosphatidate cytidylyltransferase [Kingella negevensis]WII90737.1 phosphatidate cytidylyltransferase [Kingella negevensis]
MNSGFYLPVLAGMVFFGIFILLGIAALLGKWWEKRHNGARPPLLKQYQARVYMWWTTSLILLVASWFGRGGMIALTFVASFAALREFMTQIYRHRGDHNAVATCFYILLPLQYYFVSINWFSMFTILIPVYAFLLLPIIVQLSGETAHFFDRTAKLQWGLMITVYCLSHVPALMSLPIKGFEGYHILLVLFMLVVVHTGDIIYYLWRHTGGKQGNRSVPMGAILSILVATILAMCLYWITPFNPFQAAMVGTVLSTVGFFGSNVMRQIKRSVDVRHWGKDTTRGAGNVLDRVDSLCFAAPIFFHLIRYYWT